MRRANAGQIGAYRAPTTGIVSIAELQQYKSAPVLIDALVVAGGGGSGGYGGAGSAGGVIPLFNFGITLGVAYGLTVGAGGSGAPTRSAAASNGSDSLFGYVRAAGGGYGGSDNSNGAVVAFQNGQNGGSGGGAAYPTTATAGVGNTPVTKPVQGYNGSLGGYSTNGFGGAGGGAGAAGGAFTGPLSAANGGIGYLSSITGTPTYYGGGGAGCCANASATNGTGGLGGGGNGGKANAGTAGTANTGGGAGGCWTDAGVAGGSGIVILRIPVTLTATFSAGVTASLSTAVAGFKIYSITATSTTSETVTFS